MLFTSSTNGAVWTARPDGTHDRRILRDATEPQWSSDGRHLIYLYAPDFTFPDIWRSSARGTRRTRLVDPDKRPIEGGQFWVPAAPSFSPSGRCIVFGASWEIEDPHDPEVGLGRYAVYTATARGRRLRRLHAGVSPAWSPDGSVIAFSGVNGAIMAIRPDGTGLHRLLPASRKRAWTDLDFAPDGRRLLYQAFDLAPGPVINRIGVIDLASRHHRYLPDVRRATAATWSPDGRRIAYTRDEAPPVDIWSVRPDGTDKRRLFTAPTGSANTPRYIDHLAWQPRR